MWVLIREASAARNLAALLPLVEEFGPGRLAFCTDDREPEHIAEEGHMNSIVRVAVERGVAVENALVMASLNGALWHRLGHLGALAPGFQADLLLLPDLESFEPELVLKRGRPVEEISRPDVPDWVKSTVRVQPVANNDFQIAWESGKARVIGLIEGQIVTEALEEEPKVEDGLAVADPMRDLAKIAVVERHLATGRIGLGLVRGFGLQRGAMASSIAHDAHNIVVVGVDDGDMARAVQRLAEIGGGLCVIADRGVQAELPLPVAGLLSDAPLAEVVEASEACVAAAKALGCSFPAPFQMLAFLALSVIPKLKITDRGLIDVDEFEVVPLSAG
jgi:adenine deaminase